MAQKYIEGDVVMYDNKIMVVKEPRDGSHFDLSCPKEGLVYCLVDIENIKPVRLTPEILEKNGWKDDGYDWYRFPTKRAYLYYRPITMYQIVCDRCGEVFGGTDTCSALFSNKEVDIGDYSDWEMIDGKHYCPDCYEVEIIDGVYNVKAK